MTTKMDDNETGTMKATKTIKMDEDGEKTTKIITASTKMNNEPSSSKATQHKQSQKSTKFILKCDICSLQFPTKKQLKNHRYLQHQKKMRSGGGGGAKRKNIINEQFKTQTELIKSKLIKELNECEEGQELSVLLHNVQPNMQNMTFICEKVKKDISYIISELFPNNSIYLFGSAVSGLAFKDSDFDFYVDVKNYALNQDTQQLIRLCYIEMCKSNKFSRIIPIFSAKIPLLKCIHGQTGYNCDINFSNCMGVFNSRFLRLVMNLDYRIHPLMVIIKYWAQCHAFSGTGKITNYTLTLMIIFYLQIIDEPLMPPVIKFQEGIPEYMINDWNLAFNLKLNNEKKSNKTITELLHGFFKYYNKFSFSTDIICPLYGKIFKRIDFKTDAPNEFERYINYIKRNPDSYKLNITTALCVQDPFSLTHNVGACSTNLNLVKFKVCLDYACKLCDELIIKDKTSKSSILLVRLLTEQPPPPLNQIKSTCYNGILTNSFLIDKKRYILCKLSPVEYEIKVIKGLKENLNNKDDELIQNRKNISIKKQWINYIINYIIDMLKNIFLVNLEMLNDNDDIINEVKYDILKIDQNNHNNCKFIKYFQCKTTVDVWSNRKQGNALLTTFLGDEMKMSKKKFDNKNHNNKTAVFCTIAFTTTVNYDHVDIHFYDRQLIKSGIRNFFNGISSNLRNYIKGYFTKLKNDDSDLSLYPYIDINNIDDDDDDDDDDNNVDAPANVDNTQTSILSNDIDIDNSPSTSIAANINSSTSLS